MSMFLSVRPQLNAHLVNATPDGIVESLQEMSRSGLRINGGFFACRRELLEWIEPGDELVEETFARLIPHGQIRAYEYDGFFGQMDTIKDLQRLEALQQSGDPPWRAPAGDSPGCGGVDAQRSSRRGEPPTSVGRRLSSGRHRDRVRTTLLALQRSRPELRVTWVVLTAVGERAEEARRGAASFLLGDGHQVIVYAFRDAYLPYGATEVKEAFETLKAVDPDLVLTHTASDRHQDHRLAHDLAWSTFRDHLILEYEVPKYDGDLGQPNVFVPFTEEVAHEKWPSFGARSLARAGRTGSTRRSSSD